MAREIKVVKLNNYKSKIIYGHTIKEYKRKFLRKKYRAVYYDEKEIKIFDEEYIKKILSDKKDNDRYLLRAYSKWWYIDGTYYLIKSHNFLFFLHRHKVVKFSLFILSLCMLTGLLYLIRHVWYRGITVTFNPLSGQYDGPITLRINKGDKITAPSEIPLRENFNFTNWTYNDEPFDFSTPINKSITLRASYKEDVYQYTTYGTDAYEVLGFRDNMFEEDIKIPAYRTVKNTTTNRLERFPIKSVAKSAFHLSKFTIKQRLKSIYIPNTIENISEAAFYDHDLVNSITFQEGSKVNFLGYTCFYGCGHNIDKMVVNFNDCYDLKEIGEEQRGFCFYGCKSIKEIKIPVNVNRIGSETFYGCLALEKVYLSNNLKELCNASFGDCGSLKEIDYSGTKAEWNSVTKHSDWHIKGNPLKVICTDGTIEVG